MGGQASQGCVLHAAAGAALLVLRTVCSAACGHSEHVLVLTCCRRQAPLQQLVLIWH